MTDGEGSCASCTAVSSPPSPALLSALSCALQVVNSRVVSFRKCATFVLHALMSSSSSVVDRMLLGGTSWLRGQLTMTT